MHIHSWRVRSPPAIVEPPGHARFRGTAVPILRGRTGRRLSSVMAGVARQQRRGLAFQQGMRSNGAFAPDQANWKALSGASSG